MNKTFLFIVLGLLNVQLVLAQGPPVKVQEIVVTQALKLKEIPEPGTKFDFAKYAPEAKIPQNGIVRLVFKEAKLGKVKIATLRIDYHNRVFHAASVETDGAKVGRKLFKQLSKQFNSPHKLQLRDKTEVITWRRVREGKLIVELNHGTTDQHSVAELLLVDPKK